MKVELIQGSKEWLEFRSNRFGASEVNSMLERSQFTPKNKKELAEVKLGHRKVFYNNAMRDGNNFEDRAREIACSELGDVFMPDVFVYDGNEKIIASLDGINFEGDTLIEIKVSNKDINELREYYYYQIQQQLLCSGAKWAYLVVYDKHSDTIEVSQEIKPDLEAFNIIVKGWEEFEGYLNNFQVTPFNPLSLEYFEICKQIADLEAQKELLKNELIKVEDYQDDFITVYKTKGRETIDYKKLIDDLKVDTTPYKKVGADGIQIRIKKQ